MGTACGAVRLVASSRLGRSWSSRCFGSESLPLRRRFSVTTQPPYRRLPFPGSESGSFAIRASAGQGCPLRGYCWIALSPPRVVYFRWTGVSFASPLRAPNLHIALPLVQTLSARTAPAGRADRGCSAGIGGKVGDGNSTLSPGIGCNWQQKTPSGGDGEIERAKGVEPSTLGLESPRSAN